MMGINTAKKITSSEDMVSYHHTLETNRTHIDSKRGKGSLQDTLFDLSKIKKEVNVNILTDVHDREQLRTLLFFFDKTIDAFKRLVSRKVK